MDLKKIVGDPETLQPEILIFAIQECEFQANQFHQQMIEILYGEDS
jgi:hypothetical protein